MVNLGERSVTAKSVFKSLTIVYRSSEYQKSSDQKLFKVISNSGEHWLNKEGKKKEKKEKQKKVKKILCQFVAYVKCTSTRYCSRDKTEFTTI